MENVFKIIRKRKYISSIFWKIYLYKWTCTVQGSLVHYDQVRFIPGLQSSVSIQKLINILYHIKGLKKINYTIISVDAEKKAFDKTQYLFRRKTFQQTRMEWELPKLGKEHLWKFYSEHIWWWETRSFPAKIKWKGRLRSLPLLINIQ